MIDPSLINLAKQMRMDIAGAGEFVQVRTPSLDILLVALIEAGTPDHMLETGDTAAKTVAGRVAAFSRRD